MASGGDVPNEDSALMKQISCIEDSSDIVRKQKETLRSTLDLEKLMDDLGRTGKFVHMATNAIVGAGPIYLQLEVQQIGHDITKLCDKSAVAVSSFHDTADTIISTLESVYAFLLDGYETVAIGSLESLADIAKEMASEAHRLKNEFEEEEKKVISAKEKIVKKEADAALKYLSMVMLQAALFWECMEQHCRKLASPTMNKIIEQAMKLDERARRKFWENPGFINEAKQYHAQWMALRSVCGEYMLQIKETRAELYEYIRDNPTYEEARERLPTMAKQLQNTLAQAKRNIALEDAKAEEERRELDD